MFTVANQTMLSSQPGSLADSISGDTELRKSAVWIKKKRSLEWGTMTKCTSDRNLRTQVESPEKTVIKVTHNKELRYLV